MATLLTALMILALMALGPSLVFGEAIVLAEPASWTALGAALAAIVPSVVLDRGLGHRGDYLTEIHHQAGAGLSDGALMLLRHTGQPDDPPALTLGPPG